MKNFTSWITSITMLFFSLSAFGQITIGTGTTTSQQPLNYYYGHGRHAAIYTAAEMGTTISGGTITTLSWYSNAVSGQNTGPTVILLKEVGSQTVIASLAVYATETAGAVNVYSGTPATPVNGWNSIDITDFPLNSAQNLMVIVETDIANTTSCNGIGLSTTNAWRNTTSATGTGATWQYDDTGTFPACVAATIPGASQLTNRPNIILGGLSAPVPACTTNSTPVNNATNVPYASGVSIAWAAVNFATSYDVYVATGCGGGVGAYALVSNFLTTTGTIPGLSSSTQYSWYVVPKNATGDAIGCDITNATCFTTAAAPPANDNCTGINATPVSLTPQPNATSCSAPVSATTVGATQTNTNCSATATNDDVWFTFTANATSEIVRFENVATVSGTVTAMGMDLYTVCGGSNTNCNTTLTLSGGNAQGTLTGLTSGVTYLLRVWTTGASNSATFNICVIDPPPPPANNDCAGATTFNVSSFGACAYVGVSTAGATQSTPNPSCTTTGTDDDVWFTITPTSSGIHTIRYNTLTAITGTASTVGYDLYTGACGSLVAVATACNTGFGSAGAGTVSTPVLTSGTTYFLRVWVGSSTNSGSWNMCVEAPAPPPANDECINATVLTVYGTTCGGATSGTTVNATQSIPGILCASVTGTSDDDVWYSFVATATSHIVTVVGASPLDAVIDVRSGACNGTNFACADATVSGGTEAVTLTGLSIGVSYLVRIYGYGSGSSTQGTFTICITTPPSMAFSAEATTQPASGSQTQGATNVQILRLQVTTTGALNPISLTDLNLNLGTGTTNVGDISAVKVYYTTSTTFSTTTQFGTTVNAPPATQTVSGSQTLATGSGNYFWVVYDISCTATPANTIDCSLTSFVVAGNTIIPATPNPGSALAITALFSPAYVTVGSASVAAGSSNNQIVRINISGSALCPANATSVRFNTSTSTAPATDILSAKCYYTTTTTFSTTTQFGSTISGPSGDMIFTGTLSLAAGSGNYFWLVYDIACGAIPPNVINGTAVDMIVGGVTFTTSGSVPTAKTITALASYDTKANGNWSDPNTWLCGVPTAGTTSAININHNVTLDVNADVSATLTIASGKTLTVNTNILNVGTTATGSSPQNLTINGTLLIGGGTVNIGTNTTITTSNVSIASGATFTLSSGALNIGPTGGYKRTLASAGTFTISGGALTLNGSSSFTAGSFNITGGAFNLDPNDGTLANSAATQTLSFTTAGINTIGGAINIYDPPYTSTNYAIYYSVATTDAVLGSGCTITIGSTLGGSHTNTSNNNGFLLDGNISTGTMEFGTVIIDGGRYLARRHASTATGTVDNLKIRNLTVNSGAELLVQGSVLGIVGSNLINNGYITVTSATGNRGIAFCGDLQYNIGIVFTNSSTTQQISGSGFFKKAAADTDPVSADQNVVNSFAIFHATSSGGLTLNAPFAAINPCLSSGIINSSSSAPFIVGYGPTSATPGTITTGGAAAGSSPTSVTLPLAAAWSGAWVNGPLKRWFTSTTTGQQAGLPVGSNATQQFASIAYTVAPSTGMLTAQYTTGAPAGGSIIAPPLTEGAMSIALVSPTGSWDISELGINAVSGGTYTANIYANSFTKTDGLTAITTPAETVLIKRPSGSSLATSWVLNGTHVTSVTAGTGIIRLQRTAMSGFSQFALGGTTLALPLELKSFTGQTLDLTNMLYWTTASEKNMQWHIIERSVNGFDHWVGIGKKASYGDAQIDQSYSLEDRAPLTKGFYRLRSVEVDGREQVSGIIALLRKNDHTGIVSVFPNPATDVLNVLFGSSEEETVTVLITDFSGRLVKQQQVNVLKGENAITVELSQLSAGTYTINISNSNTVAEPLRFVKQ